jgi:peptidoglycan/LPS O-acetylase OafA/YrhL
VLVLCCLSSDTTPKGHCEPIPIALILAVTFGASIVMAIFTTRLIELPVLRWRDRYYSDANVPRPEIVTTGPNAAELLRVSGD